MDTATKLNIEDSFALGWDMGAMGYDLTNAEIEERFPECNLDAFASGMADGLKGDRTRLDFDPSQKLNAGAKRTRK